MRVWVSADDVVDAEGMRVLLGGRPELVLLPGYQEALAEVVVLVPDPVGSGMSDVTDVLRAVASRVSARFVLVSDEQRVTELFGALELGLAAVVPRVEVCAERLVRTIVTVREGGAELPAVMLGRLLGQIGRLQREVLGPRGWNVHGLDNREVDVLRLLADGFATREIGAKLSYSERTVKNILHGLMARLGLRNRDQAVSFAVRAGAI